MVALHCTTRSTLAPLYSIWDGASNWCKGNRHWWAEFFPKFFLPRQCHRHQFSRVSLKIQSLVGITKHHGTRRSHLDCFNYFVWQDSNQNVTTFKELRFLTFFTHKKLLLKVTECWKTPFPEIVEAASIRHKGSELSCEKLQFVSQSFHKCAFR